MSQTIADYKVNAVDSRLLVTENETLTQKVRVKVPDWILFHQKLQT